LGLLPGDELDFIASIFRRHDSRLQGLLNTREFVELYNDVRRNPATLVVAGERGVERRPVSCVLLRGLPRLDDETLRNWFVKRDLNDSSKLDLNELAALLFDMADAAYADKAVASASSFDLRDFRQLEETPPVQMAFPVAVRMFRYFDVDQDGLLDESEFSYGLRMLRFAADRMDSSIASSLTVQTSSLARTFRTADINGDGYIDVNEWLLIFRLHSKLLMELIRNGSDPHNSRLLQAVCREECALAEAPEGSNQALEPFATPRTEDMLRKEIVRIGTNDMASVQATAEALRTRQRRRSLPAMGSQLPVPFPKLLSAPTPAINPARGRPTRDFALASFRPVRDSSTEMMRPPGRRGSVDAASFPGERRSSLDASLPGRRGSLAATSFSRASASASVSRDWSPEGRTSPDGRGTGTRSAPPARPPARRERRDSFLDVLEAIGG